MYRSYISGTGSYLPEKVLTNKDLEKLVETSDDWIVARTGIKSRHLAAPSEATSDLAYHASIEALKDAKTDVSEIDLIIVATVTPNQVMPSTACDLQKALGARDVMSFDLTAACSGFLYALTIADQFIKTGTYKTVLAVGGETLSRIVDFKDRETCILFGDGAGAAVVTRSSDDSGIISHRMKADGNLGHLLTLPAGGSRIPCSVDAIKEGQHYVKMKGREIFKSAVRTMAQCCTEVLADNNLKATDIDWMIPHQANRRIIESMADQMGFPMDKIIVNLDHTGNTSAGTIPIALDEARRDGRIKKGDKILMTAFGAGLTSGALYMIY
jgi:3-oxoacyl-[acyl-carrier-protein] synthase-3